jgi:hypothetical protein
MTENAPHHELSADVVEIRDTMYKVLTPNSLSKDSVFEALNDEPIRPTEEVLEREQRLKLSIDTFCQLIDEASKVPPQQVRVPIVKVYDTGDGSTYSSAPVEIRENPKLTSVNKYPGKQLFFTETAPIETGDAEVDSGNSEGRIRAHEADLLHRMQRLSELNTEEAASKREGMLRQIERVRSIPIETVTIQYQQVFDRDYQPEIGIKVIKTLNGIQAHPIIYQGKQPLVIQDSLLAGTIKWHIQELGITLESNTISPEEFRVSPLGRIFDRVIRKIPFPGKS